ncbi:MAG: hypothetical protein OXF79_12110 [Chloroflexi bacterium]|nr:hypothetical protein [Chloroflexota bacterium]
MRLPWSKSEPAFVEHGAPYPAMPSPSALVKVETDVDLPNRERRNSGGDYGRAIIRAVEANAAGTGATADSTYSAAIESAAGFMSRTLAAAKVTGPDWARQAISPVVLGQIGRDLIRDGESLHKLDVRDGRLWLLPSSSWNWHGGANPLDWTCRVTCYGPSTSETEFVRYADVVFVRWGQSPGTPYIGQPATNWATNTGRIHGQVERSLADEASGPITNLLPVPPQGAAEGDDDDKVDPLDELTADIRNARGKALLLETTYEGFGDGRGSAPQKDWSPNRLGPNPPDALVELRRDTYDAMLAAAGTPPALMDGRADGTSQRESLRRYRMTTLDGVAALLSFELSEKLETDIGIEFDPYALDMVSRGQVVKALVAAGVDLERALSAVDVLQTE